MLACRNPPGIHLAGHWVPSGARCIRPWGKWLQVPPCSALFPMASGRALNPCAEGGPRTDWHHPPPPPPWEREGGKAANLCVARLNFFLLVSGNPAWAHTTEAAPCIKVSVDNSTMCQDKRGSCVLWLYRTEPDPGVVHSQEPSAAIASWPQETERPSCHLLVPLSPEQFRRPETTHGLGSQVNSP